MSCEFGEHVCAVLEFVNGIEPRLNSVGPWHYERWLESRSKILPVLHDLGILFGAVMGFLRWYDKRETVLFKRLLQLLGDQRQKLHLAREYTLASIAQPMLGVKPAAPTFVLNSLRSILKRHDWTPALISVGPHRVDKSLLELHSALNRTDVSAVANRALLIDQRFSAYLIEGALAAARSQSQLALDKFDAALSVDGKSSDIRTLELRVQQLIKLGRTGEATGQLVFLRTLIEQKLNS
jgi:hypothetical protein